MDREQRLYNVAYTEVYNIYEKDGLKFNPEKSTERFFMFTKNSVDDKPFALIDTLFLDTVQIKAIKDCIEKKSKENEHI